MSTKASIKYSDEFHFYRDYADDEDDDFLYLELRGKDVQFSAEPERVIVRIPPHIWESIRSTSTTLDLVNLTDEDIVKKVNEEIDERLEEFNKADDRMKGFASLWGFSVYGDVQLPREEQVMTGVKYYTERREKQLKVLEKINAIKTVNREL